MSKCFLVVGDFVHPNEHACWFQPVAIFADLQQADDFVRSDPTALLGACDAVVWEMEIGRKPIEVRDYRRQKPSYTGPFVLIE